MPENYEKLLKDKAYLEFALKRYEEREKELRELIERESSEYKRNPEQGETKKVSQVAWQVLKVALSLSLDEFYQGICPL